MARLAFLLITAFGLAACGGGTANTPPTGDTGGNPPANTTSNPPPANKPDKPEPPKPDPELWRKISAAPINSWVSLSRDGRLELLKHAKKPPTEWREVTAVCNVKAPGGTEGEEHWKEWSHKAAGAIVYFTSKEKKDPAAAVKEYAPKLAAGEPSVQSSGNVAYTTMQGGEVVVAAFSNTHGTFVVLGIVLDAEHAEHHRTIVKWAESIKE